MNTQIRQNIPLAGSISRPWLWQIWAVVIILFAVAIGIYFAFPPPLALKPPNISFLGETCTVSSRATNHTDRRTNATLLVILGTGKPAGQYSPPRYSEYARKTVNVSVAPRESRDFSLNFPVAGGLLPNTAQIEVTSSDDSVDDTSSEAGTPSRRSRTRFERGAFDKNPAASASFFCHCPAQPEGGVLTMRFSERAIAYSAFIPIHACSAMARRLA